MPHISVTIPVYNRAHLVGRTIDSVLSQDFEDWDLLVVDDGSTDDTVEVVQEYCRRDRRVHLEVNPKNLGLTRNWNRCLDLAAGPLVQVLLSDDLIDPDYLGIVSRLFDQHPEMGFVAASCRYIDADDRVISPGAPQPPKHHRAGDEALTVLLTTGFPHVSSIVMRRACYEALGKFDERIWHGPDVEMDARLASKYDFYHFGAVHTSFRRHGTNMGSLEYLRRDFLEVDKLKRRLAWGYLTEAGRQQLGVNDLESFIASTEGQVALSGVINSVAYGRGDLGRFYLREALRYDPACWRRSIFWKALALAAAPGLGQRIMQRRMSIHAEDMHAAAIVKDSLDRIA